MKRRELLMLVASGGSVFAPSMSGGSEQTLNDVVDSSAASPDETDASLTSPDETDPDGVTPDDTDPTAENDRETVELTIKLY